jgi:hypothetical protein
VAATILHGGIIENMRIQICARRSVLNGPRWPKETLKAVPNLPHRSEKMFLSSTAQQHN